MTLDVRNGASTGRKRPYRSFVYGFVALLVGAILVWLTYDGVRNNHPASSSGADYRYSVDQSLDRSVAYVKNSYFNTTTPPQSDSYIRELTDTITTNFHYTYQATHPSNLSYTYAITAHVVAFNPSKDTNQTVWDETYQLVPTTSKTELTDTVRIAKTATLPFQEYSRRIAQINAGLSLGLEATVQLTFSVTVTGEYNGKPINDSQTMTVAAPLSESVYKITDTYKQHDAGILQDATGQLPVAWWQQHRLGLSIAAGILLLATIVFWIRPWSSRRLGRTPYQKELANIYRYHDGLIIRTRHAIDVEGREHIPVSSFEDLLNLSEELRVPIIAHELSVEATRFVVIQDRTIYSYTVGKVVKESYTVPGVRS